MRQGRSRTRRFRRFSGALAFAAPLALYALSGLRDVGYWDVGEMDTVPYILGIAHPPGLPLYTLLGWAFTHAVPFGSVAARMSFLSAVSMSVAAYAAFALARLMCEDDVASLLCAWLFATGGVAWTVGTRADVHAPETACFALTVLFFIAWVDGGRTRDLYFGAAAFGLSVAMHPVGLFLLPGIIVCAVARTATLTPKMFFIAAALSACCAAVWFAYLPLRSAYVTSAGLDPLVQLGFPGGAFWDYDHPVIWSNFVALVTGADVGVRGAFQPARLAAAQTQFAPFGVLLAAVGVYALRKRIALTLALFAFASGSALFACGFTDESDVARYALPLAFVSSVLSGAGLAWLRTMRVGAVATFLALLTIAWSLFSQRQFFDQPRDDRARREVREVLSATPSNAVLVSGWTLAPALAYADYVERATGRRAVVAAWYGEVGGQLPAWVARRPVYVVGTIEGSVAGFRLERLPTHTLLYHVVPE